LKESFFREDWVVSDELTDEKASGEESFAELFESYSKDLNEDVQIGDKISGEIISIGKDTVFVDTGTKIDGIVDKEELLDDNQEFSYKVGDILDLYVVSNNGHEIRLSKALSGIGGLNVIEEAYHKAVPVEGKVKGEVKGGFQIEILQRRAFCPISQMDLNYVAHPADYVGETHRFLVTQFEERGKNIVVSRRELLKKEQEKEKEEFFGKLEIGTQLEGRVTRLMPYGAFVELRPGVEGMIHISEISWSRVNKADDVLSPGEPIPVKVIGIEPGKSAGEMKVALSLKQVTGDPWERVHETFKIGDKIKGKVTRCTKFGVFVEIAEGIEGLVHISEMSYTKRVLKPEDLVAPGDTVELMIKEIDSEKRRISLSMKEAEGDPWVDVRERYTLGKPFAGTFEKKERFGYFVNLEPGVTGLLPKSKIQDSEQPSFYEKLKPGDAMTVIVEAIDEAERKMTLGPGDAVDGDEWQKFANPTKKSIGSLGEKLQKALDSKGGGGSDA
jgi:small subunit ribosomal protein S1